MKKTLGAKNLYYPTLTILAGANIDNKPNYEAIAWGGIMGRKLLYISSHVSHYTNRGIHENKTFSINIPSVNLVKETDFGVSIGGGVQYSMTEIYGLTSEFRNSTKRDLFKVYVGEIQIGYRAESGLVSFYARYGQGENNSSLFNIGYTVSYIFPTKNSRGSKSKIFRPSNRH